MTANKGGLGLPNSFLYWHWSLVVVYMTLFAAILVATTPLAAPFPWLTLVHKLVIWFSVWESLGFGVLHGPLHAKMSPPFTDWWYRFTPGTMKYNAPFMMGLLPNTRNHLDVYVAILTYVFSARCLIAPAVTPALVVPLFLCGIYEFIFDYGQHLHTYGTQNLHFFACMCFPVGEGQLVGIQLFLSWFYFSSGYVPKAGTVPQPHLLPCWNNAWHRVCLGQVLQAWTHLPAHVYRQLARRQVHGRCALG